MRGNKIGDNPPGEGGCNEASTATGSRTYRGAGNTTREGVNNGNGYVNSTSRGRRNQQRAAIYRAQKETSRQIKLIDAWGDREYVRERGKMNIIMYTF